MKWIEWFKSEFKELEVEEFFDEGKNISLVITQRKNENYNSIRLRVHCKNDKLKEVSLSNNNWEKWNSFHVVLDDEKVIDIEQDSLNDSLNRIDYSFNQENIDKIMSFFKTVLQGWKEIVTIHKRDQIDITFEFKNGVKCLSNVYPVEELDIPLLGKSPHKFNNWLLRKFQSSKLETKEFRIIGLSDWIDRTR